MPWSWHPTATSTSRLSVCGSRPAVATPTANARTHWPAGRLHPYHEYQAHRLLRLLENPQTKTLRCTQDAMFATALATTPRGSSPDDPLYPLLCDVSRPAVILDTYRLGGIPSRRFDDAAYRSFSHLREARILEHRNDQPLRPANLHRYRDLPALLFHETVHWLGHEHGALSPDLTRLYETCCFAGNFYINDSERNRAHQQTACRIPKDDALWSNGDEPHRQVRPWHHKGHDEFKSQMPADYAS